MVLSTPQAVLKELVENALDAGARFVQVATDNTTIGLLSVTDNGHGILPADRPLLAVCSTTNKISKYDDIYSALQPGQNVGSLGFKGEALACIADIAESPPNLKMKIVTRTDNETVGCTWTVNRDGTVASP